MPEPSEIDLIQDKVQSPLKVIQEYKKKNGISTDSSYFDIINTSFVGIKSKINRQAGGSEYKDELFGIIKESFSGVKNEINKQAGGVKYSDELSKTIKEVLWLRVW